MKTLLRRFFVIFTAGLTIVTSACAGGMQEGAQEGTFTVIAGFSVVFDAELEVSELKTETVTITGYGTAPLNGDRGQALTTAKARARTQLALQAAGSRFSYRRAEDEVLFTARSSSEVSGARNVETIELTGPDGKKLIVAVVTAEEDLRLPPRNKVFTATLRESGESVESVLRGLMKKAVVKAAQKYGYTDGTVTGTIFITDLELRD
jgi:hypothetical protein